MLSSYIEIIKRVSSKQIYYRCIKKIKYSYIYKNFGTRLYRKSINKEIKIGNIPFYFCTNQKDSNNDIFSKADSFLENRFIFLNLENVFEDKIEWNAKKVKDTLWKYYLNYFDYGVTLLKAYTLSNDKRYLQKLKELMYYWIEDTKLGEIITWDPYPLSRRIVNWSIIIAELQKKKDDKTFANKIVSSIVKQTDFLYDNLEYDIRNNHLSSDAKALIYAGIMLKDHRGSSKWLKRGIGILKQRIKEEVQEDGFQYENTTSYQLVTIQDYLETYLLLGCNNVEIDLNLLYNLERMFEALQKIIRPDKHIPLLNDSVENYPMQARELMAVGAVLFNRTDFKWCSEGATLEYLIWALGEDGYKEYNDLKANKPSYTSVALENTGYYIMRSGWEKDDTYLVFDCGPMGPAHCPGHGHADALSFELFALGKPLIVDPGVYSYHDKEYRHYFKSTKAHNTVTIDSKDQSELLASFRVGRMAKTELKKWIIEEQRDFVEGVHFGYKNITHRRSIEFLKPNDFIIIDEFIGNRIHEMELFFNTSHLIRDVIIKDETKCECIYDNVNLLLDFSSNANQGHIFIEDSFVSLEWNRLLTNKKITYKINGQLPLKIVTKLKLY